MKLDRLELRLREKGIDARLWQGKRLYLGGYGGDISAFVTASDAAFVEPVDVTVTTRWRSSHAADRCKGVKHRIWSDLFALGLTTEAPPEDWRRVNLHTPSNVRVPDPPPETMAWPFA